MLENVNLHLMTMEEMCEYLRKSCCPALKEIIKQAEKTIP